MNDTAKPTSECLDCELPLTMYHGVWLDNEDHDSVCPVTMYEHRPAN